MSKYPKQISQTSQPQDNGVYELQVTNPSTQNQQISHLQQSNVKKYGNMIVLFQRGKLLITLGPDYICVMMAIIAFAVLDYFTIRQIYQRPDRELWGMISVVAAVIQVISYISIATSNPGIITKNDFENESESQTSKIQRFCNICNLRMMPRSRHCSQCNVCIKGYDHHCPWIGKCVGQCNLKRFYFFAMFHPIFLIYCILVISLFG